MDKETTKSGSAEIKDNPFSDHETDVILVCKLKNEDRNDNNAEIVDSSSKSKTVSVKFLINKAVNTNKNDEAEKEEEEAEEVEEEVEEEEDNKKNASKYVPIKYSYSGGFFDKHFAEIEVQMNLAEAKNSLAKACNILKEINYLESRKKYSEDDFSESLLETNAEENSEELIIVTDIIEKTPEQDLI